MKNACIVWNNGNSAFRATEYTFVLDEFRALGYPFEEIRILLGTGEEKLVETLKELKKASENLLLLTDKSALSSTSAMVASAGVFSANSLQTNEFGGGIFTDKEKSLMLLSLDSSASGSGYVKTVCGGYLRQKYGDRRAKLTIRAVGANAIHVQRLMAQAKGYSQGKMQYSHLHQCSEDVIEIFYDENTPKMMIDDVLRVFAEGLGDTVYALDDTPLNEQLVNLLKVRGKKISVAESFTGGGIAKQITAVAGASAVYFEGVNTYNELSKIKRLGVSEYTLKTVGAVSDQTAYEMASGLIATGDCDIAIATTGLAGPQSDRSMLPVGLCYIAVGTKEKVFVYRYKFDGSREEITQTAIHYALFLAYKQLKNM